MSYQAFQWPEFDPEAGFRTREFPSWLVQAVSDGNVRISDDLGHVRGPDGDRTVHPTDWIVRVSDGCLFVMPDELYRTMTELGEPMVNIKVAGPDGEPIEDEPDPDAPADPDNAHVEGADAPPLPDDGAEFKPPFSPTILARSARARAMQARYDEVKAGHHPRNLDDDRRDTNPG